MHPCHTCGRSRPWSVAKKGASRGTEKRGLILGNGRFYCRGFGLQATINSGATIGRALSLGWYRSIKSLRLQDQSSTFPHCELTNVGDRLTRVRLRPGRSLGRCEAPRLGSDRAALPWIAAISWRAVTVDIPGALAVLSLVRLYRSRTNTARYPGECASVWHEEDSGHRLSSRAAYFACQTLNRRSIHHAAARRACGCPAP